MATWSKEVKFVKGQFPWKAAVVAKNGRRIEVGEWLEEKKAHSAADEELRKLAFSEKPVVIEKPEVVLPDVAVPTAPAPVKPQAAPQRSKAAKRNKHKV